MKREDRNLYRDDRMETEKILAEIFETEAALATIVGMALRRGSLHGGAPVQVRDLPAAWWRIRLLRWVRTLQEEGGPDVLVGLELALVEYSGDEILQFVDELTRLSTGILPAAQTYCLGWFGRGWTESAEEVLSDIQSPRPKSAPGL